MVRRVNDCLYIIKIRLPGNPLRDLNCYIIRTPEQNLLIDTGFNLPECLSDLEQGIQELKLDMNETDVVATHFHADHSGLVDKIVKPGRKVYIGEIDKVLLEQSRDNPQLWRNAILKYQEEGFPMSFASEAFMTNPAKVFVAEKAVELTPLTDGQTLAIGNIVLRCIHTPGHTPGHICLYDEQEKLMVLGDHVLFDITPNITPWPNLRNSLKSYMESLKIIRNYDVEIPLPAHRECCCTLAERVDQLLIHHEQRLSEVLEIVRGNSGISGYDIASHMKWNIKAKNWNDFPLAQKWFAMGEALSHLYYLEENGSLQSKFKEGVIYYS